MDGDEFGDNLGLEFGGWCEEEDMWTVHGRQQPVEPSGPPSANVTPEEIPMASTESKGSPPATVIQGRVEARLAAILGTPIRQRELISLREGLFARVLPRLQRDERRRKSSNMLVFESHQHAVLAVLESSVAMQQVVNIALAMRKGKRDHIASV
jgi:hypothetical protein